MKLTGLLFLLIIPGLSSCVVYNATEGQADICDVHDKKMKAGRVRTWYGTPASWGEPGGETRINAREPYHLGCVRRPYKFAKIYFCRECTRVKTGR